jgi:hypothetical protein
MGWKPVAIVRNIPKPNRIGSGIQKHVHNAWFLSSPVFPLHQAGRDFIARDEAVDGGHFEQSTKVEVGVAMSSTFWEQNARASGRSR